MKNAQGKLNQLYITDHGDPSVGIFPQTFSVDVPFDVWDSANEEFKKFFKEDMLEQYGQWADGKVTAEYACDVLDDII